MSLTLDLLYDDVYYHMKQFMNCIDRTNLSSVSKNLNKSFRTDCKIIHFLDIQACVQHEFPSKHLVDCLETVVECPFEHSNYKLNFPSKESKELAHYMVNLMGFHVNSEIILIRNNPIYLYIEQPNLEEEKKRFYQMIEIGKVQESIPNYLKHCITIKSQRKKIQEEASHRISVESLRLMTSGPSMRLRTSVPSWITSIGHNLLQTVDFEIGGVSVESYHSAIGQIFGRNQRMVSHDNLLDEQKDSLITVPPIIIPEKNKKKHHYDKHKYNTNMKHNQYNHKKII